MDYENARAEANRAQNSYSNVALGTSTAPELQSANVINRLKKLQQSLKELNSSVDSAAEKIVGSAPTPIPSGIEGVKAERPPSCFLDALTMALSELERVETDLRNNVNRFHRFF